MKKLMVKLKFPKIIKIYKGVLPMDTIIIPIICFGLAAYLIKVLIDSIKFRNKVLEISKKGLESNEKLILTLEKLIEKL